MLVKVFLNPICLDSDDVSILLFLSFSITSSASRQLMLLGFDVAPYFLVQQSKFTLYGDVLIIIKSLNFMMVLFLKFKVR